MPDTVDDDGAEAPVLSVGYQKAKVEEFDAFAAQARADATAGEVVVYEGVEELIADLHRTV